MLVPCFPRPNNLAAWPADGPRFGLGYPSRGPRSSASMAYSVSNHDETGGICQTAVLGEGV